MVMVLGVVVTMSRRGQVDVHVFGAGDESA
jgi:hypothetical protein